MTKRVAFFDIAGTLINSNPWTYLLEHPDVSSSRRRMASFQFLPTWLGAKIGVVNDTTFRNHWMYLMAGVFKGWTSGHLDTVFDWVALDQMKNDYHSESVACLQQHHQDGDRVVLVSGMFSQMSAAIARKIGADAALGSELAIKDGVCTGTLAHPPCVGTLKLEYIRRYLENNGFSTSLADHFAYADSFSDLPLLQAVGHPVATYPDDDLKAAAETRGWAILSA